MALQRMKYISGSRGANYVQCPYAHMKNVLEDGHDQYEDRSVDPDDNKLVQLSEIDYLDFGSAVHKSIEMFWEEEVKSRGVLKDLYRDAYNQFRVRCKEYYALGLEMMDRYFNYLKFEAPSRIHCGSEIFFDFALEPKEKYTSNRRKMLLMCKANSISHSKTISDDELYDLLVENKLIPWACGTTDDLYYHGNGLYEMVDYKTSKWMKSQDEIDNDFQISFYDNAFYRAPQFKKYLHKGIEPKGLIMTLHFLRFDDGIVQTSFSEEARESNNDFFIQMWKQMNVLDESVYPMELNNLCNWCKVGLSGNCQAYNEALTDYLSLEDVFESISDETLKTLNAIDLFAKKKVTKKNYEDFDSEILIEALLKVGAISKDDVSKINIFNTLYPETFVENMEEVIKLSSKMKILDRKVNELKQSNMDMLKGEDSSIIVKDKEYFLTNYTKRYLVTDKTIEILDKADLWDVEEFVASIPIGKVESICKKHPKVWKDIEEKALKRYVGNEMIKSRKAPLVLQSFRR